MMDYWFILTIETLNYIVILYLSKFFFEAPTMIVILAGFHNELMLNLQIGKSVSIKLYIFLSNLVNTSVQISSLSL